MFQQPFHQMKFRHWPVFALHTIQHLAENLLARYGNDDEAAAFFVARLDVGHLFYSLQRSGKVEVLRQLDAHGAEQTRTGLQLLRRAIGHDSTRCDDDGAGAHGADFFEDVGGDDDDAVTGEVADELANVVFLVGVEAVGGFVENQHFGVMNDRLGQADAALESFGERVDGLVTDLRQFDFADHLGDTLLLLLPGEAPHLGDEVEKLQHRHVRVAGSAFRQVADQGLHRHWIAADIVSMDGDGAGGGTEEAGDDLHGGGFARAVGAEKAEDFTLFHRETQIVDCDKTIELLG